MRLSVIAGIIDLGMYLLRCLSCVVMLVWNL